MLGVDVFRAVGVAGVQALIGIFLIVPPRKIFLLKFRVKIVHPQSLTNRKVNQGSLTKRIEKSIKSVNLCSWL